MGHTHLLSSRQETSSRHRSVMKILVVLTLAVFTGCNAAVLLQDQPKPQLDIVPKPQLDIVTDAFWDYVAKATHTAQDILQNIKQSELGQGVNAMISESTDAVNQYTVALCGQGLLAKITHEVAMLKARLDQDLRKGVTPFIEALNPEAMKAALLQKSEELKRSLEKSVKELQVPHSEELRQQMEQSLEAFQISMIPLTQSFQTQLAQTSQELQQNLAFYGEEMKKLELNAQDLKTQLTALWESFTKKTQ